MRSGSPAQDGNGWPSAQRPHADEATSSPVRYGSGPGSDPHDGSGGRREVPFGPEISWPYGFRQLDSESREVLESAYGTGPGYSQPAVDDYGYGDPGYADPSYEGPRTPHGGSASRGPAYGGPANTAAPRASGGSGYRSTDAGVPGYHVPAVRDSGRSGYASPGHRPPSFTPSPGSQEIWPVTGAQEALRDTGPQPIAQPSAPPAAQPSPPPAAQPSPPPPASRPRMPGAPAAPAAPAASRRPVARLTRISGTTSRAWTSGLSMTCAVTSRAPRGLGSTVRPPTPAPPTPAPPIRGWRA